MAQRLDDLIRQGIRHIATFVPWQAVESDITHTLPRFLQAVSERKLTVSLILTPELGIHYPYSGLPKDIFSTPENAAAHEGGGPIPVLQPPNSFALPSLTAPEVVKRYHNFLSRMDSLLAELGKNQPGLLEGVTAVLGGGFWKYYRDPARLGRRALSGLAGDFSVGSQLAFRQRLDQTFASREFQDPSPAAAQRWKSRSLENVNRRWFAQQNEEVFRNRSSQFLRKKAFGLQVRQFEIYTPEADPSFLYSRLLESACSGRPDFRRLTDLVKEASKRASFAGGVATAPYIHWTKLGSFRSLGDAEKQFLIFQSLLVCGAQGGGVLLDEAEWFALSPAFRARAEALSRQIGQGNFRLRTDAYFLTPHLWSGPGEIWEEISLKAGPHARISASIERIAADASAKLVLVDPSFVLTRDVIQRLLALARGGKIVALPRSPLYTDAARRELGDALGSDQSIEVQMGVACRCEPLGRGQWVLYDVPEPESNGEFPASALKALVAGLMNLAQLRPVANVSDDRLRVIPLDKKKGGMGLFLCNATSRRVAGDLYFAGEVTVSDLALSMQPDGMPARSGSDGSASRPASRFGLEVPPFGILPISVDGLGDEAEERRQAALTAEIMKEHVREAAVSELPGFSSAEPGMDALWN